MRDAPSDTETSRRSDFAMPSEKRARRCPCANAVAPLQNALQHARLRFWLPRTRRFAHVGVDFDPAQATFALWCLRRRENRKLELVNAVPNRFRLRELEATLVELNVELPEPLRRYFVAALGDDAAQVASLEPSVASWRCGCKGERARAYDPGHGRAA